MKTGIWHLVMLLVAGFIASCGSSGNLAGTAKAKAVIAASKWIHVQTVDAVTGEDVTAKYPQFAGIGEYNADGQYEFFTASNQPKGDKGTWTLTSDNLVMNITSQTFGYSVSPRLVLVDQSHLDFRITLKDNQGKSLGEVVAKHISFKSH